MNENSKKIRELTEAMCAERDIRIRSRMMAVLGVLKGYSTKTVSDFVDVGQRTVHLRVARFDESGIGGLRDAPGRGRVSRARYGRIRRLADRLAGKSMLTPRKLRNWIRGRLDDRDNLCSMRRILRFLEFSSKRSATMYASAADADSVRQWQAGATGMISEAKRRGFTIVVQDKSLIERRIKPPRQHVPVTPNRLMPTPWAASQFYRLCWPHRVSWQGSDQSLSVCMSHG